MPGSLVVLGTATGDTEVRFDQASPESVQFAKDTIERALERGYLVLVKRGDEHVKVTRFDPQAELYTIAVSPRAPGAAETAPLRDSEALVVPPIGGGGGGSGA